jgi:hypothetical protein
MKKKKQKTKNKKTKTKPLRNQAWGTQSGNCDTYPTIGSIRSLSCQCLLPPSLNFSPREREQRMKLHYNPKPSEKTLNNSEWEWSLVSCVGNKANLLQKDQCGDPFPNPSRQVSKYPMCLALATTGKERLRREPHKRWMGPLLFTPLQFQELNSYKSFNLHLNLT